MTEIQFESPSNRSALRASHSQKIRSLFRGWSATAEPKLSKEEIRKKNWEKAKRTFAFEATAEDLYFDMPVKPGFWFWKTMATAEKGLEDLRIVIPHSFVVLGNNTFFYLYFDPQTQQIVRKSEQETTLSEFERILYEQIDPRYKEDDFYLLVHRSPGRIENEVNKNVFTNFSWQSKRAMSSGVESPSMLQSYIYPKGHHASITRICFKTANNKENKSSYGFKLTNFQRLHDKESKKSISHKSTICKDSEYSFDVSPIFSGTIETLRPRIESLVNFLQKNGNAYITEIVVDFIIDRHGEPTLFNVKHLIILPNTVKLHKNIDELSCSVYCTLCGNLFKRDDARKLLTYKLLWEFERHLQKRGRKLRGVDISHNSTRPCKVCDLCYTVVVSEHKLIEYEQKFALAQNVRIKELFIKVKADKRPKNRPHFVPAVLRQWRLLLLIKEIRFDKCHEPFIRKTRWDTSIFFLHVKFGCAKFTFKVKFVQKSTESDAFVYSVKLLKVFYFFSLVGESISDFLTESEIHFRITDHETGSGTVFGYGSSKTLNNFKKNSFEGQKHENIVYLFFSDAIFVPMKIALGLVSDGESDTSSNNLYRVGSVYFPDEDFYNCNIFPGQWMEIFTEGCLGKPEEEENRNRPDLKIQSNLVFLESVLEGKFDIQTSLLNVPHLKKIVNNRPFSNISHITSAMSHAPSEKTHLSSKFLENRKKSLHVAAQENTPHPLPSHKPLAALSTLSGAFRIRSSGSVPLTDVNPQITRWTNTHTQEEGLYREYLGMLKKEAHY